MAGGGRGDGAKGADGEEGQEARDAGAWGSCGWRRERGQGCGGGSQWVERCPVLREQAQPHGLESACHGAAEKGDAPPWWDCQAGWKMGPDIVALTPSAGPVGQGVPAYVHRVGTGSEIEAAIERLPLPEPRALAEGVNSWLVEDTPEMLSARDAGLRSLETEPTVPWEEVRRKIAGWATTQAARRRRIATWRHRAVSRAEEPGGGGTGAASADGEPQPAARDTGVYARRSWRTLPWTSVRRKFRPPER
jgi:hypothetical protein